ncbi:sensor histidine kinase [Profundibacterium mesophilum]|uniref:histidine kinase n=1 Tax=Profundibacterium mesophilum KAUST100406-0324 TaxID=1037889 RepID=A0A921NNK6_9RHOB|nr:ATP-binding protein [Profundibacterium mesophilum]KAF0675051.1 two-component system OmpR family phosphate regulon sensor histidine kinase PhoR [Profundibacterium mesophilum KAUST100406-0324]
MIRLAFRFRWVGAALVLFVLTITALSLSTLQSRLVDIRTGERSKSSWIVGQLEFEFLRFENALAAYIAGDADPDEVKLRFDILWSRLNILSAGTVADRMAAMQVDRAPLEAVGELLREQEARVMALEGPADEEARDILRAFSVLEGALHTLSLATVEASSEEAVRTRANLLRISNITLVLSACAVGALVLLAGIFFMDARQQRQMYNENVELLVKSRAAAEAKAQFVSVVNHELRTPLTSISGSLSLLRGGAVGSLEAPARKLVEIAYSNCSRLAALINDLLDLDKIEAGRVTIERRKCDLTALVREAIQANATYAVNEQVSLIETDIAEDVHVNGDPGRLMQVLNNLLSNAAKYSDHGGEVHVSLRRHGDKARIEVRDFGLGIPEEYQTRIFDKFQQVDSSDHRARGGTGLGLCIAKGIVESHGGRLGLQSEVSKGSLFTVELDLEDVNAPEQIRAEDTRAA